jgi:hypothetical protein
MHVEDRRALRGGSSDIFPAVLRSGVQADRILTHPADSILTQDG